MADNSIDATKLATDAVLSRHIADNSVDSAELVTGSIDAIHLSTGSVTEAKLGSNSVTVNKIASGAVTEEQIGTGAVTVGKLAANSVTGAKIPNGTITTAEIADNAITAAKIPDGLINTNQLAGNSVSAAKIQANAVGASEIAANSIGSNQLASDSLSGQNFTGDVAFDTSTLKIDASNNRVGIGSTAPDKTLVVQGADAEIAISDTNSSPQIRFRENGTTKGNILTSNGEMIFQSGGSTEGLRIDQNQNLGIQDNDPLQKLHIDEVAGFEVGTGSSSATTTFTLDSFSTTVFRTAKYVVQIKNTTDSDYQALEIFLFHDGSDVYLTQYASIFDNGAQATFDADVSAGNVRLRVTPASSDTMAYKFIRTTIEV